MLDVSTKETLLCDTFVNVKINGLLEFVRSVKIRGFDTFSRCKSRGGGYRVSYGSTLKLSGRRRYTGVTYITLREVPQCYVNQNDHTPVSTLSMQDESYFNS
jgi:hypothetical protein